MPTEAGPRDPLLLLMHPGQAGRWEKPLARLGYAPRWMDPEAPNAAPEAARTGVSLILLGLYPSRPEPFFRLAHELLQTPSAPVVLVVSTGETTLMNQARSLTPLGWLFDPPPADEALALLMEAHLRNGRSTGQPHPAAEPFFQCQDRFQLLVESMPDPVVMYDLEGRVSFVNDSFTRTYGWSLDELAGRRLDFVPPHEREKTKAMLDEARTMDRLYLVFQTQRLTKDGRLLDIELRGSAIRDRAGRVVGTMAVHVDHTEKLRAEKALSESEERYRKVLEASPDAVAVYDQSGRITYLNPAFEQTFGWNLEDLMGKGIDFVPEHEKKKTYEAVMRTLKGENVLLESQRLTRDGRLLDIQLKTAIFLDAEGKLAGDVVIYRDITEKKRAEEALRRHRDHLEDLVGERTRDLEAAQNRYRALYEAAKKAEELYRSLFEASADAIVVYDLDGLTRYLNPAFTQAFGWTLAEVIGRKIPFVPDEEQATTLARVNEIIQGGAARRNFETRRLTKDGRVLEVNISASRYHDHEGRPAGLLVLLRDVTETKRTETELTRARGRMQNVIDSMPSLLVGVDRDLRVTYWNAQATRETGLGPGLAKGLPVRNVLPILEPYLALVRECLEEGRPRKAERIRPGVPGDDRFLDLMVYPLAEEAIIGAVIRLDDVTTQARIEEMMVQTEKMMSLGALAAGMAHEINNPLGGVVQGVQNVQRRLDPGMEANRRTALDQGLDLDGIIGYLTRRNIPALLDGVLESGHRAARIVAHMLEFSRAGQSFRAPARLDHLLEQAVELAASDYDLKKQFDFRHIQIVKDFDPLLPLVPCEATKIEQVLLNLLKNAAQALAGMDPPNDRPYIRLATRRRRDQAEIQVEDNGPGIPEGIRKRIFEPFFTTKPVGAGTGLGLAVSYFIVTETHKGRLSVESTSGRGARFIILLPLDPSPSGPGETT